MDRGHETLNDGEVVVDDLGERGEAVGRARRIGEDFDVGLVRLLVDANDKHGCVGGWSRDDDLLSAALQMRLRLLRCGEDAG